MFLSLDEALLLTITLAQQIFQLAMTKAADAQQGELNFNENLLTVLQTAV
jgi:hypothetical protein